MKKHTRCVKCGSPLMSYPEKERGTCLFCKMGVKSETIYLKKKKLRDVM